jgi:hypothetical protein
MAVGFAVPLVFLSRLILLGAPYVFSEYIISGVSWAWKTVVAPVDSPAWSHALDTFFLAFVLGPVLGLLLRLYYRPTWVSNRIIDSYGSGLEKFLNKSVNSDLFISVTLDNRKVYVGFAGLTPRPQPRREEADNYFGLLPVISGYREEGKLRLHFTTDYTEVYEQVEAGMHPGVSIDDFEITIPVERVVTVNPFSLDIEQGLFDISLGQEEETAPPS